MALNPILVKTLLVGSLVVSSVGIAAISNLFQENKENLAISAELIKDVNLPSQESYISNSSTVTQTQHQATSEEQVFKPQCEIFVVEKPEWYWSWGEVKWRLWTYKVKRKPEGNNSIYKGFVEKCLDLYKRGWSKRAYVYYDNSQGSWMYDDYLQWRDWRYVLGEESRFDDYKDFKI